MKLFALASSLLFIISSLSAAAAPGQIVVGANAPDIERYAAKELQRYLYQISGELLPVVYDSARVGKPSFVVGQPGTNRVLKALADKGVIRIGAEDPGPQGYVLKKATLNGKPVLVITGGDAIGTLYGVYGLLDDHYNVGFYLGGDVLSKKSPLEIIDVDELKKPQVEIRGFLPWTNFPQSATVYSWEDWKFIIDQMAKMRMNFLHIHNYNGSGGHNEMFHNFNYGGILSRVWMPTARTGHGWAGPKWDVNQYLFGAKDLFDDYDFGADCTLHNENLSNFDTFRKGASMFQKVIAYAHSRGVKVGLGLDINEVPLEYSKFSADDPGLVDARADQIADDYPDLDYLICFQYENSHKDAESFAIWTRAFDRMYKRMKERSPQTRLAVAGWGIKAEYVEALPNDVICAPISAYSAGFESGSIYGDREYWGCPWLERDFNSSEYYYPYNMHLSDTIKAWQKRALNMKGLYCLTWRLTDAIDPKISYIAKAPWDTQNNYATSRAVYHEYAARNYGKAAAEDITGIINQNEPFASRWGECQGTPAFSGTFRADGDTMLFNVYKFHFMAADGSATPLQTAAEYSAKKGTQNADCSEGGQCVGYIRGGNWLRFDNFDFGKDAATFEARVASDTDGGYINLRLDNPDTGKLIGTMKIENTGGWQQWTKLKATIIPTSGKHTLYLVFQGKEANDLPKAQAQLAIIDKWISKTADPGRKDRLKLLRCRIAAESDYIWLNRYFPELEWSKLPGRFGSWARNFTHRVTDISSLGNVQSSQNRFVQLNYLGRVNELRKSMNIQPPSYVEARGTKNGAIITWQNEEKGAKGFYIYRNSKQINARIIPASKTTFTDKASGSFAYSVSVISANGRESARSIASMCDAGKADLTAPEIVVVSPPVSVASGQPASVKARILDNRSYSEISAALYYRTPGPGEWTRLAMLRRVKAVFTAEIPASAISSAGVEYYIEATDGSNQNASRPLSLVSYDIKDKQAPGAPGNLKLARVDGKPALQWQPAKGEVFWYRIYRSRSASFIPGAAAFITYVYKNTTTWADNGEDFNGVKMTGDYYYRVTAVDKAGNESAPAAVLKVAY